MDFTQLFDMQNAQDVEREAQMVTEEAQRKHEIATRRHQLVCDKLRDFASKNEMDYLELSTISPNHFMIGGLVFTVAINESVDKKNLEAIDRMTVLWQFLVKLVGFDRTDRIREARVGALAAFNTESIRRVYNEQQTYLVFDHDAVVRRLASKSSD